jgi:hypothetical protein
VDRIFVRRIAQRATTGAALKILLIVLFSTSCGSVFHQPGQSKQRFSLASLKGNYTYNLAGMIFGLPPGYNLYHETGAFVADGNGGLTGVDDFSSGATANLNQKFAGSYTIGGDGTGTMSISLPGRPVQLAITLRSTTELYLLEYDAFATGTGGAFAQASSAISGTLSGAYVFRFYTHVLKAASSAAVGRMMISGTSVTGDEDVAQIGTITATPGLISGSLTQPDSNGRGTVSLTDNSGMSNYVYYAIDSNTLNLIRTDTGVVGEGRAVAQTVTSFTNASIASGFTFHVGGDTGTNLGGVSTVGTFTSDGKGNLTSGSRDSAEDGTTSNETFTATYAFDSTGNFPGRASLTVTPTSGSASSITQVAWMADSTQGFMLEEDSNRVAAGAMLVQQGGPFSATSLNGEYAVRMVGFDGTNPPTVGRIGVMTFDGSGTVTFTDLFVNRGGIQAQYTGLSGSYTVSPNGRAVTADIHGVTVSMIFYLTSNQSAYFLLGDSGAEVAGQNGLQSPQ